MKKLYTASLLCALFLFTTILQNCNTQNNLTSAEVSSSTSTTTVNKPLLEEDLEEQALLSLYGVGGPFEGIDPKTEIIEKRSLEAKHFRNEDGTMYAMIGAGPIHYKKDGEWKTISINPQMTGDKDHPYAIKANTQQVYFPSASLKEGIKVDLPNELKYSDWNNLKFNWLDEKKNLIKEQKVSASDIDVKGEVITYRNLLAGIDAVITNGTDRKKVDYVIDHPKSFDEFYDGAKYLSISEEVEMDGLEMADIREGHYYGKIEFKDRYGNVVMNIEEAKLYDKSTSVLAEARPYSLEANAINANYRVSKVNSKRFTLETIVPIEWLKSELRTFPITIDPTTNYAVTNQLKYTGMAQDNGYCSPTDDVIYGYYDQPGGLFLLPNSFGNGFATFNLTNLQTCEVYDADAHWRIYTNFNGFCGDDVDVRLGNVKNNYFMGNNWPGNTTTSCGTHYNRIDNNENDYSGQGKNNNQWQTVDVKTADMAGHVGGYFTYGWNYLSGNDNCTWCVFGICSGAGDDSEYYFARGYYNSSRPYLRVFYRDCGDAESFGDQVWHVHGYNNQNLDVHALVSNGSYRGKYVASQWQSYIHNTARWEIYSHHWWDRSTESPSAANSIPSGYSGSVWSGSKVGNVGRSWQNGSGTNQTPRPGYSDNFTTAYKRRGFPCAEYQIRVNDHDDFVRLAINEDSNVWQHTNGCCDNHTNVWQGILDESSRVTFTVTEGGGGAELASQFYLRSNWTGVDLVNSDADGLVCVGTNITFTSNNIGSDLPSGTNSFTWNTPNGTLVNNSSTLSGVFTKNEEGLYSVTRTRQSNVNQGGKCEFTDYFNVSVSDLTPTVGIIEPTCHDGNDGKLIAEVPNSGLVGVRSIRLYQQQNKPLNVNEIEVYDMNGVNIASVENGGVASMHSHPTCQGASGLNDGNLNDACGAHTNTGVGVWQQVTWPGSATISKVRVYNRVSCCWDRLDAVQLRFYRNNNGTNLIHNSGNLDLNAWSTPFVDYDVDNDMAPSPTFTWSGGLGTGQDQNSVTPGTYNLTVTPPTILASGCSFTSNGHVVPNPTELTLSATTSNEVCPADNNGSINLSFGGYPEYSVPHSVPNLKLWTRADAGVKLDRDGKVEEWQDLSGNNNGFYLKHGAGALPEAGAIGSQPALAFGGESIMHTLDTDYTGQFTMFVVGRMEGTQSFRLVSSSNKNWLLGWHAGTRDDYFAEGWINNSGSGAGTSAYIYSVTKNGSNVQTFRRNGTQLASNSGGTHSPGQISLGGWGENNSEMSRGYVAEVIYYSRNLSAAEIREVEEYLEDRYSITAGGTVTPPTYLWSNGHTGQDPSGLDAGSYTVTMTDFNGCTVNGGPYNIGTTKTESTTPTGPGTQNVCNGAVINLTATGGVHGTNAIYQWWSGPNGTGTLYQASSSTTLSYTAPATSGTYHVYLRRVGDCNTTSDHDIVINVNAQPTAYTALTGGNPTNTNLCVTSLALTPTGGGNGSGAVTRWYNNAAMTGAALHTGVTYTVNPQSLGVGTHSYWVRREPTGVCAGANSAGYQVNVVVDGGAPSVNSVVVSNDCWPTDNINTYTITVVVTDNGSGIGEVNPIINQDLGSGLAGGWFSWSPSAYQYPLNQMASTGVAGYASQNNSWGNLYNALVGCNVSTAGNQTTVVFTVRPNASYIAYNDNDISVDVVDDCGNATGYGSAPNPFQTNFTSYQTPLTTATVNGLNTVEVCTDDSGNSLESVNLSTTLIGGSSFVRWEARWGGVGAWSTTIVTGGNPTTFNPSTNCGETLHVRALTTFGTCSAFSNEVTIATHCTPSGTTTTSATQVCEGTAVSLNTTTTTGTWVQYQYQLNGTGGSWIDWTGATQAYNWTPGASDGGATRYVRAELTNGACEEFFTTPVAIQVDDPPSLGFYSQSGPIETCLNSGTISANTVFGATGNLQWQYGTEDGAWANWFPFSGINSGTGTFPVNPSGGGFAFDKMRITSSNGLCPPVEGAPVLVQNKNTPNPTSLTADVTSVCVGYVGTINLTATFPYAINSVADVISDYSTVQFYSGTCGSGVLLGTVAHTNGIATLNVTAPAGNTTFWARGISDCENSPICQSVEYTVNPQPVADTIIRNPEANAVCAGDSIRATFAGGFGGGGAVNDIYEVSTNGGATWTSYTPGAGIPTNGLSGSSVVRIRTRRVSTGQNCNPSTLFNEEFWDVHTNSTVGPTQTVTPNISCPGTTVTLSTNSIAGFGSRRNWYDGKKPGGNLVGEADQFGEFSFIPTEDHTYYLYLDNGACPEILADSVTHDVRNVEDNIVLPDLVDYNNLTEECTIGGWTYYADPADSEKWLFAINKNGNTATFDVDLGVNPSGVISSVFAGAPPLIPSHGSYLMRRYWNVNVTSGSITANGGIAIRFFYNPADLEAARVRRNQDFITYSGKTRGPHPQWFKTNASPLLGGGTGFAPSLLTPGMGNKWTFPYEILNGNRDTLANVPYVQFDDLTSLSGGTGGTTFGEGNPTLPVELVSLTATGRDTDIYVEWLTASEVNNEKFEVLRSEDAVVFTKIGEVAGNGTTSNPNSYDFVDANVEPNKLYYYKLNQIDFDGTATVTEIVSAMINVNAKMVIGEFTPNPAFNQSYVDVYSPENEEFKVLITNMIGQEVGYIDYIVEPGSQKILLNIETLVPGNYLVTFQSDNGLKAVRKLQVIK